MLIGPVLWYEGQGWKNDELSTLLFVLYRFEDFLGLNRKIKLSPNYE